MVSVELAALLVLAPLQGMAVAVMVVLLVVNLLALAAVMAA